MLPIGKTINFKRIQKDGYDLNKLVINPLSSSLKTEVFITPQVPSRHLKVDLWRIIVVIVKIENKF